MNNSIKMQVSYKYNLLEFFYHFKRLVDDHHYLKLRADFKASQTSPALSFLVKLLRNAAKVYTPSMLKWFQSELCKTHDYALKLFGEIGTMSIYEIIAHGKRFHHMVTFDSLGNTMSCSCKKFEFAGILCAHALKVLSTQNIKTIPSQYILKRWTHNIKYKSTKVTCPDAIDDDPKAKIVRCYNELSRLHTKLAIRATESNEAY